MATVAKVTIPMDNVVHSNLIQFLLEAKQPQEDKNKKPAIVIPEEKSNGK